MSRFLEHGQSTWACGPQSRLQRQKECQNKTQAPASSAQFRVGGSLIDPTPDPLTWSSRPTLCPSHSLISFHCDMTRGVLVVPVQVHGLHLCARYPRHGPLAPSLPIFSPPRHSSAMSPCTISSGRIESSMFSSLPLSSSRITSGAGGRPQPSRRRAPVWSGRSPSSSRAVGRRLWVECVGAVARKPPPCASSRRARCVV